MMDDAVFPSAFATAISQQIWDMKYRLKDGHSGAPLDATVQDTWRRVAQALAAVEKTQERALWQERFYQALNGFKFLPAGRILVGAGTDRTVTLFNCFVMGIIPDTMGGIFEMLKEAALTMQQGGGIGYDFSTIRPKGAHVAGVGADASGPVSFMDVWDAMCRTIMSAGSRRGAMMAVLRCDHPDIEDFIDAKSDPARLRNFNVSVLATDAFMQAVAEDRAWPLVFEGKVFRTISAKELWMRIMRATYDYAEPGVIFIDQINRRNNLWYAEQISATNPCGEQPLPPYGACLLGSINLAALVNDPFEAYAELDRGKLEQTTTAAVRMMDNVVDTSRFALLAQEEEAHKKRRIGLGVTGLADALAMHGLTYGSDEAIHALRQWLKILRDTAYRASVALAAEKGPFPLFDRDKFLKSACVQELDADLRAEIAVHGIRNALLTSIAPTGTISLYAGNVSSGIEPIFATAYQRRVLQPDGSATFEEVRDFAVTAYYRKFGEGADLPDTFVTAQTLSPEAHLKTQAAAQAYIDSAISKTINLPEDISFEDFQSVYRDAYALGCKGCTTYRPNAVTGSVLSVAQISGEAANLPSQSLEKPLDRPEALLGATYKLRWPNSAHAMYITLNDVEFNGRRRPFEIFINSKNMEHYAWIVALTRMISAIFRRGGDISFVVDELKAVFDPRGGAWIEGAYVPSILAAIGGVVERHLREIGFVDDETVVLAQPETARQSAVVRAENCDQCGSFNMRLNDGCAICGDCGFSRCA